MKTDAKLELPILAARFAKRDYSAATGLCGAWLCGVQSCGQELGKASTAHKSKRWWRRSGWVETAHEACVVLAPEMVRRSDGVWIRSNRNPFRASRAWMKADGEARGETPDFTAAHTAIKQLDAMIENTGSRRLSWSVLNVADLPAIIQCPCSKCRRLSKISSVRGVTS